MFTFFLYTVKQKEIQEGRERWRERENKRREGGKMMSHSAQGQFYTNRQHMKTAPLTNQNV